jgi:hypothetical protein
VVNATVETALPDPTTAAPELAVTVGGATTYCGRPSLQKRGKAYKLAAADGALKSIVLSVNAKRHRSKLRVTLTDPALAPADGAAIGVSLDTRARRRCTTSVRRCTPRQALRRALRRRLVVGEMQAAQHDCRPEAARRSMPKSGPCGRSSRACFRDREVVDRDRSPS